MIPPKVWARIDLPPDIFGCWLWKGAKAAGGYGQIYWDGRNMRAHRVIYSLFIEGELSPEYELHHRCHNRLCVNPGHLVEVTHQEHISLFPRIWSPWQRLLTHCKRGHPLSGENLWVRATGARICRTCQRARHRAWVEARRI